MEEKWSTIYLTDSSSYSELWKNKTDSFLHQRKYLLLD